MLDYHKSDEGRMDGANDSSSIDIISGLYQNHGVDPKYSEAVRAYLQEIGSKGGRKSRRRLEPAQARRMVAVREARRAFRKFKTQCFWSFDPKWPIHLEQIPLVIRTLREEGDASAFATARYLHNLVRRSEISHADRTV